MANRLKFNVIFRRTLTANLRYYGGLIELTANYLQGLAGIFSDVDMPSSVGAHQTHQPLSSKVVSPALVFEAESGEQAHGMFSIENKLTRRVQARVAVSAFHDPKGKEVNLKLHFEPKILSLEPGEKFLVQAIIHIDEQLEPGVRYRGQITVPDLSESPVPVVVRRLPNANLSRNTKVAKGTTVKAPKRARRTSRATKGVRTKT